MGIGGVSFGPGIISGYLALGLETMGLVLKRDPQVIDFSNIKKAFSFMISCIIDFTNFTSPFKCLASSND